MKKKDLITIIDNAIKDNVPYIAIKQHDPEFKKPIVFIEPRDNFIQLKNHIESQYDENLEIGNIKIIKACILKEVQLELKLFLKI